MKFSMLAVPGKLSCTSLNVGQQVSGDLAGAAPGGEILGAENGKEKKFTISEYKGRWGYE